MNELIIKDLHVEIDSKEIIKGVNLSIKSGEIHAIMGPNGSGKSTLAYTIAGHPKYKITKGQILINGESIKEFTPDERAKAGLFLASQLPVAIEGISLSNFLRAAISNITGQSPKVRDFVKDLDSRMQSLNIPSEFANRSINVGFSGGERKRAEILQLQLLHPRFAILDETDSGLDVDAIKTVSKGINQAIKEDNFGSLIITHHKHLLDYITPDYVHIFSNGQIIKSGDKTLVDKITSDGYSDFINK